MEELGILESWSCYFTLISETISETQTKQLTNSSDVLDTLISKLICCIEGVMRLRNHILDRQHDLMLQNEEMNNIDSLLTLLDYVILNLDEEICSLKSKLDDNYTDSTSVQLTSVCWNGLPGRPKLCIDIEQISSLRALGLNWVTISKMLGISRSTLYRRCSDEGFEDCAQYSSIRDEALDGIISGLKNVLPHIGERIVLGHLRRIGLVIQRERVRQSIHRVDPLNTALRWNFQIKRRSYSVAGPNSLWHIGE